MAFTSYYGSCLICLRQCLSTQCWQPRCSGRKLCACYHINHTTCLALPLFVIAVVRGSLIVTLCCSTFQPIPLSSAPRWKCIWYIDWARDCSEVPHTAWSLRGEGSGEGAVLGPLGCQREVLLEAHVVSFLQPRKWLACTREMQLAWLQGPL